MGELSYRSFSLSSLISYYYINNNLFNKFNLFLFLVVRFIYCFYIGIYKHIKYEILALFLFLKINDSHYKL